MGRDGWRPPRSNPKIIRSCVLFSPSREGRGPWTPLNANAHFGSPPARGVAPLWVGSYTGAFYSANPFPPTRYVIKRTKDRPWRSLALSTCPFPLSLGISTPPLEILARSGTRSHLSLSASVRGPPPLVRSLLTSPRQMKTIGRHHRAGEPTGLAHGLWASTHRDRAPPGTPAGQSRTLHRLALALCGWVEDVVRGRARGWACEVGARVARVSCGWLGFRVATAADR
jgi:hypothetical protein